MATQSSTPLTPAGRKNRRDLYLIVGTFVFVIVSSTLLYMAADRGMLDMPSLLGTSNRGDLLEPPVRIEALGLRHPDGRPFDFASEDGAWTLLVPATGVCEGECGQNLYLTRQVRTALGRDAAEVKRLVVALGAPQPALAELVEREHPGVPLLTAAPADFDQIDVAGNRYFLVDPYGWVMMAYTPAHDGKELMADLKFLLKYAPDRQKE